jgi:uncharacterized protein (DUF488 family)
MTCLSIFEMPTPNSTAPSDHPKLWTIGHSTHPIGAFLDLLKANGIEILVDVRSYPGSRRHPQFNKEPLAESVRRAGLAYQHMVSLGGRRKKQDVAEHDTHWRNQAFANYADYTKTEAFRDGLAELEQLARGQRVAIMCAEALWWKCHRRFIADEAAKDGFEIAHIMGPKQAAEREAAPELPGL